MLTHTSLLPVDLIIVSSHSYCYFGSGLEAHRISIKISRAGSSLFAFLLEIVSFGVVEALLDINFCFKLDY